MSTTAQESAQPAESGQPQTIGAQTAKARRDWQDHAARTTAVLAVLAALSSGQYAGQFSRTILAQAEATDLWAFYQAKSIKKSLKQGQIEVAKAMAVGRPEMAQAFQDMETSANAKIKEYDGELATIKTNAENSDNEKRLHQKKGDRFQIAFIFLQVGVVLSTVAAGARKRAFWVAAILAGVIGLAGVADGFLLFW